MSQGHYVIKYYKYFVQIGLNIMRFRKERGLTQKELGDMTGYSYSQIGRVESASSVPTLALLLDVAEALDVPLEWILEDRKRT